MLQAAQRGRRAPRPDPKPSRQPSPNELAVLVQAADPATETLAKAARAVRRRARSSGAGSTRATNPVAALLMRAEAATPGTTPAKAAAHSQRRAPRARARQPQQRARRQPVTRTSRDETSRPREPADTASPSVHAPGSRARDQARKHDERQAAGPTSRAPSCRPCGSGARRTARRTARPGARCRRVRRARGTSA